MWKWIVIGGNFFIIAKINWVTSQFLNMNFKSGSRTSVLSKVEFIVTGAAVTMFSVKLVLLLSLINIAHSLKIFGKSLNIFNIFKHDLKLQYLWQEQWKLLMLSMNETLSWSYEWNLIVWANWIFHDTHFASWNISTLFFRNKNFKVVKEKCHRISPPLAISTL